MSSTVEPGDRVRLIGVGLVVALLAGCRLADETTSPIAEQVTEAVQNPQEKLLAATATSATAPYSYTVVQHGDPTDEIKWSGSVDPAGKAYDFRIVNTYDVPGLSLTLVYRIVGPKLWAKAKFAGRDDLDLPRFTDKWMLVDRAKVTGQGTPAAFTEADVDPAQLSALLTTVGVVTEAAPGKFTGTFDLTQQPDSDLVVPATRKALAEKARSLRFTASVSDGHVTDFVLWIPATSVSKAQTYAVKYTGFGTVAPVTAPTAAETARTPDALYEVLAD